jgi:osmoprotectant transport system ATP-binding protein
MPQNLQSPVIFQNVSHSYGQHTVLQNINLAIEDQKITVILGKSGSGKSTLLQMINRLLVPARGSLIIFGRELDSYDIYMLRRSIGYAIQGIGLFPHLTVYDNIALLPKISQQDRKQFDIRIDYLINLVGLNPDMLNKYPHQLSGGEQQRVGICRAMILNPKLFLLDEAFGALDLTTRNEIHSQLLKLQAAEPRTVILVTHDVGEALKLADYILLIEDGEILQYGATAEIRNNTAISLITEYLTNRYE